MRGERPFSSFPGGRGWPADPPGPCGRREKQKDPLGFLRVHRVLRGEWCRFLTRPPLALALALALGGSRLGAQVPPNLPWRSFETAHFRVTYPLGLDSLARHAGAAGERAYARLSRELTRPPKGRIELILADNVDFSNGETSAIPYEHIYLYARPPVGDVDLGYFPDWMEQLVDHELTHAFHLDRTSTVGHVLREVFGRVPMGWPVFPVQGTPGWNLEGMAVFYESHLSGQGRIYGSYHDMVLRAATLEGGFWPIDRVTGESPRWPGGDAVYIYGSYFLDWLGQRYGPDVEKRIVQATATQRIPSFGTVARRVTGRSWPALWREWQDALRARYAAVADSVRARGLTRAQMLTRVGYFALYPRVSPDGRFVALAAQDPRRSPETAVYDVARGRLRRLTRRNSLDAAGWLPDGRLLTTQLEFRDRHHIYSDLYLQGPGRGQRRLTRGARLEQLDVRRDGAAAVAVEDSAGMTRLAWIDLPAARVRPLGAFDAAHNWSYPRLSPDGRAIAAAHWQPGGSWSVVVVDANGAATEIAREHGLVTGPAWSPDGRWLLWESDRTGIPNIFAAPAAAPGTGGAPARLHQVTNVLGGAFWPEVSPDGRWLYFSGYHADGWHLERMPFDTSAWQPVTGAGYRVPPPDSIGLLPRVAADTMAGASHGYSPWPTLRPRFWVPALYGEGGGTFFGAATGGTDAALRHSYALGAAYDFANRHAGWQGVYDFAGLGNPVLELSATRSWDDFRFRTPVAFTEFRRNDEFAAAATFVRPRVRSSMALTFGADLTLRTRSLVGAPDTLVIASPNDRLKGVFAGVAFANYQTPPYSISREDGMAASLAARRHWNTGFAGRLDAGYSEGFGSLAAYRSLALPGFAHHVLALRAAGLRRGGPGAEPFDIGGVPGTTFSLGIADVGTPGRFLFVRGYPSGARTGTDAWSGSLEYRLPIALVDRGWGTAPWYVDRVFAHAFADAGNAWCPAADTGLRHQHGYLCSSYGATPLLGAGAELGADGRVLIPTTLRFRAGVGFPLTHRQEFKRVAGWVTLGSSF